VQSTVAGNKSSVDKQVELEFSSDRDELQHQGGELDQHATDEPDMPNDQSVLLDQQDPDTTT